jgi:multidrug efflux pump subunit AcrB
VAAAAARGGVSQSPARGAAPHDVVVVRATLPGAAPEIVEQRLTVLIESVTAVPGVTIVRSSSTHQRCVTEIHFPQPATAAQADQVADRIASIRERLPAALQSLRVTVEPPPLS